MDLVWLLCLRPMGYHLLNFFGISGRRFRSSAVKLRLKDNIGKFPRRSVFVSAFDAPARRCAGKTSFFAPIYLALMKASPKLHFVDNQRYFSVRSDNHGGDVAMQCWPSRAGPLVQYRPEAFRGCIPKAPRRAAISVVLITIYSITETMSILNIIYYQSHAGLTPS